MRALTSDGRFIRCAHVLLFVPIDDGSTHHRAGSFGCSSTVLLLSHRPRSTNRQVSLLISLELLIIPSPTTLLPFHCILLVTLRNRCSLPCLSHGETQRVEGFARHTVKGSLALGGSPTGLAETSSLYYRLINHRRLLPTFPHGNAVTTGFRAVTLPWTGLAPVCSSAFTGALATVARRWTRHARLNS